MALMKSLAQSEPQPAIDKAKLMTVSVDPENKLMSVHIAKGYEENNEFVVKSMSVHQIAGDDYDALMQSMGNPELAVGEMLQEAIWAKLEAMGAIDVQ